MTWADFTSLMLCSFAFFLVGRLWEHERNEREAERRAARRRAFNAKKGQRFNESR